MNKEWKPSTIMVRAMGILSHNYRVTESWLVVEKKMWVGIADDGQKVTFCRMKNDWEFWAKHQHATRIRNAHPKTIREMLKKY
jgi:hypothetical protein